MSKKRFTEWSILQLIFSIMKLYNSSSKTLFYIKSEDDRKYEFPLKIISKAKHRQSKQCHGISFAIFSLQEFQNQLCFSGNKDLATRWFFTINLEDSFRGNSEINCPLRKAPYMSSMERVLKFLVLKIVYVIEKNQNTRNT